MQDKDHRNQPISIKYSTFNIFHIHALEKGKIRPTYMKHVSLVELNTFTLIICVSYTWYIFKSPWMHSKYTRLLKEQGENYDY